MTEDPVVRTVQRSVGPTIGLCTDVALYFRANDFVAYEHDRQRWRLSTGGSLWFNTYFNALSVRRWKDTAPLRDLRVELSYSGRLQVRLHVMRDRAISDVVDERTFASQWPSVARWSFDAWPALDDGIVFLSVNALEASTIDGFSFRTATAPVRDVRLGLCITHYDRKPQVVPAIARLKRQLLDDPEFAGRADLIVVDNSRNLEPSETDGATLLPNRNLGGAGGFARGLMHLKDDGSFTHALFMDDDASCEVESIRRTIALLGWARDPRTAVSGAMLSAVEPYRQFESGARFDGLCTPLRTGIDLRDPAVLAWNEREQTSDYGAWWFFAFPLDEASGYPYPYFVRGDDIDFSLRNDFRIVNTNGVASWQEDFAIKHGPQTNYLDTRNHLMQLLHGFRGGRRLALYVCLRMFLIANLAGQYEVAACAVMAIDDVRRGPDFFRDHADLVEPRRRLQASIGAERMRPLDIGLLRGSDVTRPWEPRWRGALRHLTANGHLLPRFLFHRRPARFGKTYLLPLRGTFRRQRTIVYDELSRTGMVLEHSKTRFFTNLWRFSWTTVRFVVAFDRLSRAYRSAYPTLTGDAFWRTQFASVTASGGASEPQSAPVAPAAAARAPRSAVDRAA